MSHQRDVIFAINAQCGTTFFESDGNIFNKPSKNLSEYKLDLVDHPKAGNLGVRSSLLSLNRGSARVSPSVSSMNLLSPAASKGMLGFTGSSTKLSRSGKGSMRHLSIPIDTKHQNAIQEVTSQNGSFTANEFIIISKSVSQYVAVLEQYETCDDNGTLRFQLLSTNNDSAQDSQMLLSLVQEARSISYIFVSSLLCVLPSIDSTLFVLDYHSSNLQQILNQNNRRLHENGARFYMAEILLGLEYLHDKNIIYKDLCPENVLITETGHVKLVNPIMWNGINKVLGTPGCNLNFLNLDMAPELIHNNITSKMSDIWAFGCILFELLTGGKH